MDLISCLLLLLMKVKAIVGAFLVNIQLQTSRRVVSSSNLEQVLGEFGHRGEVQRVDVGVGRRQRAEVGARVGDGDDIVAEDVEKLLGDVVLTRA